MYRNLGRRRNASATRSQGHRPVRPRRVAFALRSGCGSHVAGNWQFMLTRASLSLLAVTIALALAPAANAQSEPLTGPATSTGTGGAAATVDRLATTAAMATLRRGGNATDAAVVAAAVLGVTEPFSCGHRRRWLHGPLRRANKRRATTIDHRETAPAAMGPASFLENGAPLPFAAARYSGLSVGVPGHRRGWADALRRDGTISLAERARTRDPGRARRLRRRRDLRRPDAGRTSTSSTTSRDRGAVPRSRRHPARRRHGVPQPGPRAHAPTLIARHGHEGLLPRRDRRRDRRRPSASRRSRRPPNHTGGPALMASATSQATTPREREPTRRGYRGLEIFGMGPPSSGGSTVGEALNILEGYPAASLTRAAAIHRRLEAARFSFADRNAYLADPAFFDVPLPGPAVRRLRRRAPRADRRHGGDSPVAPGDPYPFDGGKPGKAAAGVGDASARSTTHLSSRTATATSSRTRSRSSRPAARGSSCRATASC